MGATYGPQPWEDDDMRIISCGYSRTYNTGNYTSRRFEAAAELEDGEGLAAALAELVRELHDAAAAVLNPPRTDEAEIPY
jgi:hypothetical protein